MSYIKLHTLDLHIMVQNSRKNKLKQLFIIGPSPAVTKGTLAVLPVNSTSFSKTKDDWDARIDPGTRAKDLVMQVGQSHTRSRHACRLGKVMQDLVMQVGQSHARPRHAGWVESCKTLPCRLGRVIQETYGTPRVIIPDLTMALLQLVSSKQKYGQNIAPNIENEIIENCKA